MRTIASQPYVYTNGSLDGPQSATGHEWSSFDLPYDMMFGDGQADPHTTFGNDDKSDDVHSYGNYLHDDLQPTVDQTHNDDEQEEAPPATMEPMEQSPVSPVVSEHAEKPSKKAQTAVDPYAAGFLEESLGPDKWATFSARLFERRLTGPRSKNKKDSKASGGSDGGSVDTTASVIDFLCKAEAVKEVLRVYVPHPYNPHKTLSHNFSQAPSGRVTLSRSTVLALSGWSNTQFSYWARRSEAIGVLAYHDRRLRMVANALSNRLRGTKITDEVAATDGVTGKGLDFIIDEVKERTGASPFIHGKHSSLDPFSIIETLPDGTPADPNGPWVDYTPPTQTASSHYISTTFPPEPESTEDGTGMQYYLSNLEYPGSALQNTELDTSPAAYGSPEAAGTVAPSAASPPTATVSSPKRGRPGGGLRAKRGAKAGPSGSAVQDGNKSPTKRKNAGDSEFPQQSPKRKRAKTNASSIEDS